MQKKEIIKKYNKIGLLVSAGEFAAAFEALDAILIPLHNVGLSDELNRIKTNYRYLASYMLDGGKDSSREEMLDEISEGLYSLCDNLMRNEIAKDSSDSYSEILRYNRLTLENLDALIDKYTRLYSELTLAQSAGNETLTLNKEMEDVASRLFNAVWVSLNNKSIANTVIAIVKSDNLGSTLPLQLINALILSLSAYFDRYKLEALITLYQAHLSEEISARSLLGIMLTLNKYPQRSAKIKQVRNLLTLLQDSLTDYQRLKETVKAIIRTRDTDRVAAKMKDEVLPEIMKMSPEIIKKMREADPDSMEAGFLDNNPEWEEMLEKSGLNEKMRELSEMQSEGSDLMMVAFSNLKNFPFFNSISNWFLPFNANHSAVPGGEKEKMILERLMEVGRGVCDSDKYSLALALGMMPESQKNLMLSQLDAQFAQLREDLKDRELESSNPRFNEEITKAVRDFYRFFKLFRKKDGFEDPFKSEFKFTDLPVIGEMLSDTEIVTVVAEFYFKRKYYPEALTLFNYLLDDNSDDPSLWEKVGFCYQQMKFFDKALEAYTHAELLKTPGSWLLKRLAFVNRRLGNFSTAADYYRRLLEKDPENINHILNAAYCELESGNPEKALPLYYHANYLSPEKLDIFRAIAWCEFLNGNDDKSEKYHKKILSSSQESTDLLNYGHLELVKGQFRDALNYYKQAASGNFNDFRSAFLNDLEVLEKRGVEKRNAMIVLDAIKLDI